MAAITRTNIRARREREEEVLVWQDLVFIEFIAATLFTLAFTVISALFNAPLINQANPNLTPNPSKAPWYFMNLQELLLHMNPALAGVIVPTIALILIAAIPYIDRETEGQGVYFGTPNSVKITIFSAIYSAWFTVWLIIFDMGRIPQIYTHIFHKPWLGDKVLPHWVPGIFQALYHLILIRNTRAIQTEWKWRIPVHGLQLGGGDGYLNWPQDFTHIPMPFNGTSWPIHISHSGQPPPTWFQHLPGWLTGLYWYDLNLNLPAFVVEIFIPVCVMVGLPLLLVYVLWRIGWVNTRRDMIIALFSGFLTTYWVMTIVGAAFRGAGQELVLPWSVPHIDG